MSLFLLQSEKSPNALPNKALFSEDVSSAFARIDEYNWRNYSSKHRCVPAEDGLHRHIQANRPTTSNL